MRAKKTLGQNFLKNPAVVRTMVQTADVQPGDTVLEIGPGKGALTEALLAAGAHVIAIEKDADLIPLLEEKFARQHITIIQGDVREYIPEGEYKVAANIPYYITGEIIRQFLESDHQPTSMTLLVQKEVAQRIVANNGKESILSISVKAYGTPKYIQKVPAHYFTPAPKVDSAILHISNISKAFFRDNTITEQDFFAKVRQGFSQKRKKLGNNLDLTETTINPHLRAEDLTLNDWKTIAL